VGGGGRLMGGGGGEGAHEENAGHAEGGEGRGDGLRDRLAGGIYAEVQNGG
jgi:hypothetical protein